MFKATHLSLFAGLLTLQVDAQCSISTASTTGADANAAESIVITSAAEVIFTHDNTACSTCDPSITLSIDSYGTAADMLVDSGVTDNVWNVALNAPEPAPAGGSSANSGGDALFFSDASSLTVNALVLGPLAWASSALAQCQDVIGITLTTAPRFSVGSLIM